MSDIAQRDAEINQLILTGKAMDAFEKYYADDVVMQENFDEPCVGKDANRKREYEFFGSIEQFHGAEMPTAAVGDDVSYSEWVWDLTFKGGHRVQMKQVARREWRDGLVVHERFYYNKG